MHSGIKLILCVYFAPLPSLQVTRVIELRVGHRQHWVSLSWQQLHPSLVTLWPTIRTTVG